MLPKIIAVHPGSLAEELEFEPGDELLTINGQPIRDIVDLQFALAGEELELVVKKTNGEEWAIVVEKEYDELLGAEFEHPTIDRIHLCHNKCVFCFVDQIPKNMRKTLNMRDDDYRLSFLHGNFVTLTNLKAGELERIAALKMSPLNISVHTTNPELRVKMLGNNRAGEILDQIRYLADNGIEMNTQIVLCPGWNDGAELDRTIEELAEFYPAVRTLSVVPVGLTQHREGLVDLRPCTGDEAAKMTEQLLIWQDRLREKLGANFVHAADEFYVIGKRTVPPAKYYDEFAQIENGVGMIRTFLDEFARIEPEIPERLAQPRKVAVVTGVSAMDVINERVERLNQVEGLHVDVYPVVNEFYGNQVTVTGLVCGSDIVKQLRHQIHAQELILPDVMLKEDSDVFLDDYTLERVQEEIGVPVRIVPTTASGLIYGALGKTSRLPRRKRYESTLDKASSSLY